MTRRVHWTVETASALLLVESPAVACSMTSSHDEADHSLLLV